MSYGLSQQLTKINSQKAKSAADIAMEVELKKQDKPEFIPAKALPAPAGPTKIPAGAMPPDEWIGKFTVFMGGSLMQLLRGVGAEAVADFACTGYEAYILAYSRLTTKFTK